MIEHLELHVDNISERKGGRKKVPAAKKMTKGA